MQTEAPVVEVRDQAPAGQHGRGLSPEALLFHAAERQAAEAGLRSYSSLADVAF